MLASGVHWQCLVLLLQSTVWATTTGDPSNKGPLQEHCASGANGNILMQLASRAFSAELLQPIGPRPLEMAIDEPFPSAVLSPELLQTSDAEPTASWPEWRGAAEPIATFSETSGAVDVGPMDTAAADSFPATDLALFSSMSKLGNDTLATNRLIAKQQYQGADESAQEEELGPAANVLSALELFLEQPYSDLSGPRADWFDAQSLLFYVLLALCGAMVLTAVPFIGLGSDIDCCGDLLGLSLKAGIQKFDRSVLGVDVEIGRLELNPFNGYLDVEHLIIHNPPGYSSPYLLKATKVLLDIDTISYLTSAGNKVSVERLVFKDIEAIYEKKWAASNMDEVLNHINQASNAQNAQEADTSEYELHRIDVHNVGVHIRPSGEIGEYVAFDMEAGDCHYRDFHSEVGHVRITDIVRELLKSILKTVISNIAGKHGEYLIR